MSPDQQIARITSYVADTLFAMGSRDLAASNALAREFAPVAYRSLAEAMRCCDGPAPVADEAQQVLVWAEREHASV